MRAMTLRQWARHLDGRAEVALVTDELRLGLSLGFWATPGDATQTVLAAERLGYDSVWTSEGSGSDALTPLAWYGARTTGSSWAQRLSSSAPAPPPRPRWPPYGVPFGQPLARTASMWTCFG